MSIPALIYIGLTALGLGVAIEQHGKPKTGTHNVFTSLVAASIGYGLLYWGGFFS